MPEGQPPRSTNARLEIWRRGWNGIATIEPGPKPLIVALSVLALILLVLEARIFSPLPAYPATALVFFAILVVPGLTLHQAVLGQDDADVVERLAISLALGLTIAAPSGLLTLFLHFDLQTFGIIHASVAALTCGSATLIFRRTGDTAPKSTGSRRSSGTVLLALLLAVAIGGILTSPVWAGNELARDFDDWRYMTHVNSYMHAEELNAMEPVGIGEGRFPRLQNNVWLVVQAAVASAAGVTAEEVVMSYLTPLVIVFALAATYALARGLFGSRSLALLAVVFLLGYALIDLSPHEGIGRNLLLRASEDKMVGTYVLFPLGLLFVSRFLAKRRPRDYLVFCLICLALFVVHFQPLVFLAVVLLSLVVLHPSFTKSAQAMFPLALLALPVVAFNFGNFFVWHTWTEGPSPLLTSLLTEGPPLFQTDRPWDFRESFRIVRLPADLIMGNYHLIIHPIMLSGLLLASVVWLRGRASIPNQVLVAATVGWLPWFFIPPFATVFGQLMTTTVLIRLPWMAPSAVVLAYVLHEGLQALRRRWTLRFHDMPVAASALTVVAPTVAVLLVLAVSLLVHETYIWADGETFYNRTSSASILPGAERSVIVGGGDRLFSGEWRLTAEERELFTYLRTRTRSGSVVLAEPLDVAFHFPGLVWDRKPAYSDGVFGSSASPPWINDFRSGFLRGPELADTLEAKGIDYVVVVKPSLADRSMEALSTVEWLVDITSYSVYAVH